MKHIYISSIAILLLAPQLIFAAPPIYIPSNPSPIIVPPNNLHEPFYPPLQPKSIVRTTQDDVELAKQSAVVNHAYQVEVVYEKGLRIIRVYPPNGKPYTARIEILQPNFDKLTYANYANQGDILTRTSVRSAANIYNLSNEQAGRLMDEAKKFRTALNENQKNKNSPIGPNKPRLGAKSIALGIGTPLLSMYLENKAYQSRVGSLNEAKKEAYLITINMNLIDSQPMRESCELLSKIPSNHVLDNENFFMTGYRTAVEACQNKFPEIKFNVKFPN